MAGSHGMAKPKHSSLLAVMKGCMSNAQTSTAFEWPEHTVRQQMEWLDLSRTRQGACYGPDNPH